MYFQSVIGIFDGFKQVTLVHGGLAVYEELRWQLRVLQFY
jgi:hypothetical protein